MEGYLFLQHTQSNKQPIMLGDYIHLTKPSDFDDEFDDSGYLTIKGFDLSQLKHSLWISVWDDFAYGETINIADTREEIVAKSIEQLRTDYPLNDDVEAPFDMDSYVSYALKKLEKRDCFFLKHHPLEPEDDLTPPVLVIKKVMIKK